MSPWRARPAPGPPPSCSRRLCVSPAARAASDDDARVCRRADRRAAGRRGHRPRGDRATERTGRAARLGRHPCRRRAGRDQRRPARPRALPRADPGADQVRARLVEPKRPCRRLGAGGAALQPVGADGAAQPARRRHHRAHRGRLRARATLVHRRARRARRRDAGRRCGARREALELAAPPHHQAQPRRGARGSDRRDVRGPARGRAARRASPGRRRLAPARAVGGTGELAARSAAARERSAGTAARRVAWSPWSRVRRPSIWPASPRPSR